VKKKNFIAKELRTPKFKSKVIKAKKGKGSFKRKK
jgi:stalled ribosome alternative rescue factor ArfA|tara:strand:- start:516 stop:620 length:105 start_codon:yes stop_codon:yes gene_type:complete